MLIHARGTCQDSHNLYNYVDPLIVSLLVLVPLSIKTYDAFFIRSRSFSRFHFLGLRTTYQEVSSSDI